MSKEDLVKLQAELDLLREQEAALAAKEAELESAKDALPKDAIKGPEVEVTEIAGGVQIGPVQPLYREHGRLGEEGGV